MNAFLKAQSTIILTLCLSFAFPAPIFADDKPSNLDMESFNDQENQDAKTEVLFLKELGCVVEKKKTEPSPSSSQKVEEPKEVKKDIQAARKEKLREAAKKQEMKNDELERLRTLAYKISRLTPASYARMLTRTSRCYLKFPEQRKRIETVFSEIYTLLRPEIERETVTQVATGIASDVVSHFGVLVLIGVVTVITGKIIKGRISNSTTTEPVAPKPSFGTRLGQLLFRKKAAEAVEKEAQALARAEGTAATQTIQRLEGQALDDAIAQQKNFVENVLNPWKQKTLEKFEKEILKDYKEKLAKWESAGMPEGQKPQLPTLESLNPPKPPAPKTNNYQISLKSSVTKEKTMGPRASSTPRPPSEIQVLKQKIENLEADLVHGEQYALMRPENSIVPTAQASTVAGATLRSRAWGTVKNHPYLTTAAVSGAAYAYAIWNAMRERHVDPRPFLAAAKLGVLIDQYNKAEQLNIFSMKLSKILVHANAPDTKVEDTKEQLLELVKNPKLQEMERQGQLELPKLDPKKQGLVQMLSAVKEFLEKNIENVVEQVSQFSGQEARELFKTDVQTQEFAKGISPEPQDIADLAKLSGEVLSEIDQKLESLREELQKKEEEQAQPEKPMPKTIQKGDKK